MTKKDPKETPEAFNPDENPGMFDPGLRDAFKQMHRIAHNCRYEFVSVDLLVMTLLGVEDFNIKVSSFGIRTPTVSALLSKYIAELTPTLPPDSKDVHPRLTEDMRDLLGYCFRIFHPLGRKPIRAASLLGAVLLCHRSMAAKLFKEAGLEVGEEHAGQPLSEVSGVISDVVCKKRDISGYATIEVDPAGLGAMVADEEMVAIEVVEPPDDEGFDQFMEPEDDSDTDLDEIDSSTVETIQDDLFRTASDASAGESEPFVPKKSGMLIGRSKEILAIARVLLRKEKNNALLLGEPGVGKTAVMERLMSKRDGEDGDSPPAMRRYRWHPINTAKLQAGRRGGPDREFRRLLATGGHAPVLVIDNFGDLLAPPGGQGGMDELARFVQKAMDEPHLRVLAACNYSEFNKLHEQQPLMMRRFQTIDIEEPDTSLTREILLNLRDEYGNHHGVIYPDESLDHILACAERFDHEHRYPEKAIDIMDEAGTYVLLHSDQEDDLIQVTPDAVEAVARLRARIEGGPKLSLEPVYGLEETLSTQIFNQAPAIAELAKVLKVSFSDLHEGHRPRGSFLFVGPTGVGKTELTKQLAKALNMQLHRYDMSEFSERHTSSRLIGAPPGYVGFEDGGQIVGDVRKAPHSVVLLDELEKAHENVINLMLQIMDYGALTSSSGTRTRFGHCIIVATTNAGAAEVTRSRPGFHDGNIAQEYRQQLERSFSPEFINRFDAIIHFNSLTEKDLAPMVAKLAQQLNDSLEARDLRLHLDDDYIAWLCHKAFDAKLGARPLARLFQEELKLPIADYLGGEGKEAKGEIRAHIRAGEPVISWPKSATRQRRPKARSKARPKTRDPKASPKNKAGD